MPWPGNDPLLLADVAPDGGPLGLVPGTHRLACGPWETLRTSFRSSMTLDAQIPQAQMPNHFRYGFACALTWFISVTRPDIPFVALQLRGHLIDGGGDGGGGVDLQPRRALRCYSTRPAVCLCLSI